MGTEKVSKKSKQIQDCARALGTQGASFQSTQARSTNLAAEIKRLNAELQQAVAAGDDAHAMILVAKLQKAMREHEQLMSALSTLLRAQQEQMRGIIANMR